MNKTSPTSPIDHDEIVSNIPMYIKGKLTHDEHTRMEDHLNRCDSCRQELIHAQMLKKSMSKEAETWKPSPNHFSSILAQVDQLEIAENKKINEVSVKPGLFKRISNVFRQTPSPMRWTLAVETLAFAVLAIAMILPAQLKFADKPDSFATLSDEENQIPPNGKMYRVVFADNMTAKELSELLIQSQAQIRQGPSAIGAYTVEIPVSNTQQAQETLKTNPKVRLVLPVEKVNPS